MNLRLFIVALLATVCVAYTMEKKYKMPGVSAIRCNFFYVDSFGMHTKIFSRLARQEKTAQEIADIIDESLKDYGDYLDRTESAARAQELKTSILSHKSYIIELILDRYPDALDELEKVGRYKPRNKE